MTIKLFIQCAQSVKVRVLFDALDECNDNDRGSIFHLIERFWKANIGVYVTIRPRVVNYLRTRFADAVYMENIEADEEDVRNVLEDRIRCYTGKVFKVVHTYLE